MKLRKNQEGQAVIEYILLLAAIVSFFLVISRGLDRSGFAKTLMKPISEDFARAYQYGHVQAKGFDHGEPYNQGGPRMHPRIPDQVAAENFRIFYNPGRR